MVTRSSKAYGLILAGGRGTRFWPRSRRSSAKQVLRFFGEHSLIQQTVDRLRPVIPPERIWVMTNHHLRAEIVRQLPDVPARQILAEPAQRNTAPAIGLAAHILHSVDPDAVMGVFPADQLIAKARDYTRLLRPAFRAAREGKIAVLGIKPRWAETGYGYIEFPKGIQAGAPHPSPVLKFREKPDAATAAAFVREGNFYWNAGMFFWRASVLLDSLRQFLPKTASLLDGLPPFSSRQFAGARARRFSTSARTSRSTTPCWNARQMWSESLLEISAGTTWEAGTRCMSCSAATRMATRFRATHWWKTRPAMYVDAKGKLVALLGVKDLIVVDTPDALLIADRRRAQEVGDLVKRLEKSGRHDLL